jgi:hypothetical protein
MPVAVNHIVVEKNGQRHCSLPFQIPCFFTLSLLSIFGCMYEALNVDKINN